MSKVDERIKELELKLKQAKALKQKQAAQARAADAKKARAAETRRKILAGAIFLENLPTLPEDLQKEWAHMLDSKLTRDDDRALFGLKSLPKAPVQASGEQS